MMKRDGIRENFVLGVIVWMLLARIGCSWLAVVAVCSYVYREEFFHGECWGVREHRYLSFRLAIQVLIEPMIFSIQDVSYNQGTGVLHLRATRLARCVDGSLASSSVIIDLFLRVASCQGGYGRRGDVSSTEQLNSVEVGILSGPVRGCIKQRRNI